MSLASRLWSKGEGRQGDTSSRSCRARAGQGIKAGNDSAINRMPVNTFYLLSALRRLRMAAVIPFMAACLWCSVGCKKKAPAAAPPPLVEFVEVKPQDVPIYHEWIGSLDGLVNAQIRAQVTGYLLTQNYREGDVV